MLRPTDVPAALSLASAGEVAGAGAIGAQQLPTRPFTVAGLPGEGLRPGPIMQVRCVEAGKEDEPSHGQEDVALPAGSPLRGVVARAGLPVDDGGRRPGVALLCRAPRRAEPEVAWRRLRRDFADAPAQRHGNAPQRIPDASGRNAGKGPARGWKQPRLESPHRRRDSQIGSSARP
jgi:hypothetical protein